MEIYSPRLTRLVQSVFGCSITMLRLTTPCGHLSVLSCCERLFSQMRILEIGLYLAAVKILICEMSRCDDKTSSCNHDIDLVIGIALMFC